MLGHVWFLTIQIRAFIIFIKNIIHFIELKTLMYLLLYVLVSLDF